MPERYRRQNSGGVAEKNWGGMPERVKKTKCGGWGGLREKFEGGGYAGEGKEDEMRGGGGWRVEKGGGGKY